MLSKENLDPDECIAVSMWNGFVIGDCIVPNRVMLIRNAYWKGRESLIECSTIYDENIVVVIKFLNCGIRFSKHVETN